jgi:hypothetical protein
MTGVRRIVLIVCVLMLAAASAGVFAWRWADRGPGRASVGKAIDRYRTSSTVAPPLSTLTSRPGVYIYEGEGSERVSFMNTRQIQGPTEPGTVTALRGGCWLFQIDFNSFHSQRWARCNERGRIVEKGGAADQKFDFVMFKQSDHGTTTCNPPFDVSDPHASPGTTWPVRCRVRSSATGATAVQNGTMTFLGHTTVVINGTPVTALHARENLQLSGGQTGNVYVDLWLTPDGLPLREQHNISVVSPAPSPINHVSYTESGSWQLTSLEPQH